MNLELLINSNSINFLKKSISVNSQNNNEYKSFGYGKL